MAVASVPPHIAARMNQEQAEREAMCSPDPVVRYRAKENVINRKMTELSSILVQNAQNNAKIIEQIEKNEAYSLHY